MWIKNDSIFLLHFLACFLSHHPLVISFFLFPLLVPTAWWCRSWVPIPLYPSLYVMALGFLLLAIILFSSLFFLLSLVLNLNQNILFSLTLVMCAIMYIVPIEYCNCYCSGLRLRVYFITWQRIA